MIYYKSKKGEVRTKGQWLEWASHTSYRLGNTPDAWHKVTKLLTLTAVWVKNPKHTDSVTLQPVWEELQDSPVVLEARRESKSYFSSYEQYPESSACMKKVGWEQ